MTIIHPHTRPSPRNLKTRPPRATSLKPHPSATSRPLTLHTPTGAISPRGPQKVAAAAAAHRPSTFAPSKFGNFPGLIPGAGQHSDAAGLLSRSPSPTIRSALFPHELYKRPRRRERARAKSRRQEEGGRLPRDSGKKRCVSEDTHPHTHTAPYG